MADDESTTAEPQARCPWCSSPLPASDAAQCPACGATLINETEPQVPGVTVVPQAAARPVVQKRPNRLLQWITGESGEPLEAVRATPGSLAPPPAEVRREILRLELEAEIAERSAEVSELEAEARIEGGQPVPVAAQDAEDAAAGKSADASGTPAPEVTDPPSARDSSS